MAGMPRLDVVGRQPQQAPRQGGGGHTPADSRGDIVDRSSHAALGVFAGAATKRGQQHAAGLQVRPQRLPEDGGVAVVASTLGQDPVPEHALRLLNSSVPRLSSSRQGDDVQGGGLQPGVGPGDPGPASQARIVAKPGGRLGSLAAMAEHPLNGPLHRAVILPVGGGVPSQDGQGRGPGRTRLAWAHPHGAFRILQFREKLQRLRRRPAVPHQCQGRQGRRLATGRLPLEVAAHRLRGESVERR